jgi:phosphodiesterase/alkaline phosphatase D-like protein
MPSTIRAVLLVGSLLVCGVLALPLTSNAAPPPPAPKPPFVFTGYAPEASTSSAIVRGAVNPRGVEASFYVQYGTTTSYGAQTPPAVAGSGTQEVKVSQTISGLQPNTAYHYRILASSSAGTTTGEDRSFTTKKIPLTLEITAKPRPDLFGSPFSISGTLSGSESANHGVVLQANPFPI